MLGAWVCCQLLYIIECGVIMFFALASFEGGK